MTVDNFNWFIHTMLIYHTQSILRKQTYRVEKIQGEEEMDDDNIPSLLVFSYYLPEKCSTGTMDILILQLRHTLYILLIS